MLSELARSRMLADEFDAQIAHEALELAEQLGLSEVRAHVLITAGMGRQLAGDPGGRADIELGLELARAGVLGNARQGDAGQQNLDRRI